VDLLGGLLLYAGPIGAAVGALSVLMPLRVFRIRSRRRALQVFGVGFLVFAAGVYLPIRETRVESVRTKLDEFFPMFQFHEVHGISIAAPAERVYAAIWSVPPEEIRWYRTLTSLRRVGKRASEPGILNPPQGRPLLQTFTAGGFRLLADDRREIVVGSSWLVRIAMNFRIEEIDAGHCFLTTETRVHASGVHALRGFAAYWRMIQPGSALIRRSWLRAIRLRAEAPHSAKSDPMGLI
jgi:hypothetical protein